jgi:hypothetical protein
MKAKKITYESISNNPQKGIEKGKKVVFAVIYGFVSTISTKKVKGKHNNTFLGQFQSENLKTGERIWSSYLVLKGEAERIILEKLNESEGNLLFALGLSVTRPASGRGYFLDAEVTYTKSSSCLADFIERYHNLELEEEIPFLNY